MLGKVQDEVTERWEPRLRVASRASGGRKNPRRGTTCDLHSRIRLGHSEGLNKACVGGGGSGEEVAKNVGGSQGFPTRAKGWEFGFQSGWEVWETGEEFKSG